MGLGLNESTEGLDCCLKLHRSWKLLLFCKLIVPGMYIVCMFGSETALPIFRAGYFQYDNSFPVCLFDCLIALSGLIIFNHRRSILVLTENKITGYQFIILSIKYLCICFFRNGAYRRVFYKNFVICVLLKFKVT